MKINIFDKKEFIQNFVEPISTLNSMCCLGVKTDGFEVICSTPDNTLAMIASTPGGAEGEATLNIPDIKRLSGAFNIIKSKEITITFDKNNIKYNDGDFKFSYHLLEEGLVRKTTLNKNKIQSMEYTTKFKVNAEDISTILKGTSFASTSNKLYITQEGSKIVAELDDKTKHNVDSFVGLLAETAEGMPVSKPLPINLDTFRLISFNNASNIEFSINDKYGIVRIDITKGVTKLTYILSALIN